MIFRLEVSLFYNINIALKLCNQLGTFLFHETNYLHYPKCLFLNTHRTSIYIFTSALFSSRKQPGWAMDCRIPGRFLQFFGKVLTRTCRKCKLSAAQRLACAFPSCSEEAERWQGMPCSSDALGGEGAEHELLQHVVETALAALRRRWERHKALQPPWRFSVPRDHVRTSPTSIIYPSDLQLCSFSALASRKEQ